MVKALSQQRAALHPTRGPAYYDDNDLDDQRGSSGFMSMSDDGSSVVSSRSQQQSDTLMLAQFLATTGPEEYSKLPKKQSDQLRLASRFLNRLRKRQPTSPHHSPVASVVEEDSQSTQTTPSRKTANRIQLPVHRPPSPVSRKGSGERRNESLRDSGLYSTTSDKDTAQTSTSVSPSLRMRDMSPSVSLPTASAHADKHHERHPRRPAPLPQAVASAAIAAACRSSPASVSPSSRAMSLSSNCSERSGFRSVPVAALKRRSGRPRHNQVQTDATPSSPPDKEAQLGACPHCRQKLPTPNKAALQSRRLSSPPALASGPMKNGKAESLLVMIEQLKEQLAEEQRSRRQLELAMSRQQTNKHLDFVAREKDRWNDDRSWLNDRIALLPQ